MNIKSLRNGLTGIAVGLVLVALMGLGYSVLNVSATPYTDDTVLTGNGTSLDPKAIPNCADTVGSHLNYTASTNTWSCGTSIPANDTTGSTGTFTATYSTGCTTQPTQTFSYAQVGAIVYLQMTGSFTCTGNATTMVTSTPPLPAAIWPTSGTFTISNVALVNNGTQTGTGCIRVLTTGNIQLGIADSTGCQSSGWTASGTRSGFSGYGGVYSTN